MKGIYRAAYTAIYTELDWLFPPKRAIDLAAEIRQKIDDSEKRHQIRLRPDAKVYLLINFTYLVSMPVHLGGDAPLKERLSSIMGEDVDQLIEEVIQQRKSKSPLIEDREISAHELITATNSIWEKLGTGISNVWS